MASDDAAYIRESKQSKRKQDTNSERNQRMWIKDRCRQKRRGEPKWYIDLGVTGRIIARDHFRRLLLDVYKGKIGRIILYRLDRLVRGLRRQEALMDYFARYGVEVECSDYKTSDPKMMRQFLGMKSEQEVEDTRQRTKDGLKRVKREKRKIIGRPPGGLTKDRRYKDKTVWKLDKRGEAVATLLQASKSERAIQRETKIPMRTLRRIIPRVKAWLKGDMKALGKILKEASVESKKRTEKVERRIRIDDEWLDHCLISPSLFGRQDLWRDHRAREAFLEGKA